MEFKEQFPSLIGKELIIASELKEGFYIFNLKKLLEETCLDKARVKDEIEHITDRIICIPNYSGGETHVQYAYRYANLVKKVLKKKLGLE